MKTRLFLLPITFLFLLVVPLLLCAREPERAKLTILIDPWGPAHVSLSIPAKADREHLEQALAQVFSFPLNFEPPDYAPPGNKHGPQ